MPKKGKTNHKKSCQSFSFILKTDYIHLKTNYKDESACLWKQLKWKKLPFHGDRLSGKNFPQGLTPQTACLGKSLKRNKVPW